LASRALARIATLFNARASWALNVSLGRFFVVGAPPGGRERWGWARARVPAPGGAAHRRRAARRLPQPWWPHRPPARGGGEAKMCLQVAGAALATPARWARRSVGQESSQHAIVIARERCVPRS
jgi:hypothetical protein